LEYFSFNSEKGVDKVWHKGQSGAINMINVYSLRLKICLKFEEVEWGLQEPKNSSVIRVILVSFMDK